MTRIAIESGAYADNLENNLDKWELFDKNNKSIGKASSKDGKVWLKFNQAITKTPDEDRSDGFELLKQLQKYYSEGSIGV